MNNAIFFDLYGTLVDIHTDEDNPRFWDLLACKTKKYREYQPIELKKKYKSLCAKLEKEKEEIELLDVFESLYEVSREEALKIASIFRKLSTKYIRLYPKVKSLLKCLLKMGYDLYILSNAQESFTIPELKKFSLLRYFKGIAISSMYGVKKPNVEFFKRAAKKFGVTSPWMIGNDYECDILPASSLGWKTIFIESNLTPSNSVLDKIIGFDKEKIINKIISK